TRSCVLPFTALHRPLHSFPTRRSSDLTTTTTASLLPPSGPPQSGPSRLWTVDVAGGKPTRIEGFEGAAEPTVSPDGTRIAFGRRSEEHTSELQSLRHLVCRLLLEKKK